MIQVLRGAQGKPAKIYIASPLYEIILKVPWLLLR